MRGAVTVVVAAGEVVVVAACFEELEQAPNPSTKRRSPCETPRAVLKTGSRCAAALEEVLPTALVVLAVALSGPHH